jgi:hypothetical protein
MSHPPYDCEDCGVYHGSWSGHQAFARKMDERDQRLASIRASILDAARAADVVRVAARLADLEVELAEIV